MGSTTNLPYWQVNVPEPERTAACPPFLQNLNAKDLRILATPDSHYHVLSWAEVVDTVAANRLDLLQRVPSELRRYRRFTFDLARTHGGVANFILQERLQWEPPVVARGKRPFEYDDDLKTLFNDWPYGIDKRIVHLVVWTKFELEEDSSTGDLTDHARAQIDEYVEKTFRSRVPRDQVIWFKNWNGLKSVHAVEHFHVMMLDSDPEFVKEITKGDVPMCDRIDR